MAQVNPQLTTIIELMTVQGNDAAAAAAAAQTSLNEHTSQLGFIGQQTEFTATYTGETKEQLVAVNVSLTQHTGLLTEIRDKLGDIHAAILAWRTAWDASQNQVLIDLELLINNGAANTEILRAAICGDCPPPVDPGEDFDCWIYQNTSGGPDDEQGLPFNSGPGFGPFNAGEGVSIHWRGNEYLEDKRIYVWQTVPDLPSTLIDTLDSAGDFVAFVWNGNAITVSASEWPTFPKNQFSVWVCPDGVEPPP